MRNKIVFKKALIIICVFVICELFLSCGNKINTECETMYIDAVQYYSKNELDNSFAIVKKILKKDSGFYSASLLEGKIYFFRNDFKKATNVFEKLVKKYPEYTDARLWLIRCLILTEKYPEAEKLLEQALSFNVSDWRFYYQYALLANATGDYKKRIAMLNRAESYLEESSKVYLDLAKVWFSLNMNDRSISYLQKASFLLEEDSMLQESVISLKKEIYGIKE